MRILFVSDNFPPEGNAPATRLYEHATRWVRAGHEVTVITGEPNFPEGKLFAGYRNRWRRVESVGGIRVVRVKTYIAANSGVVRRTLDYASFMLMAFVIGVFERRPDVVVATSPQFFCALGGWALATAKRRPFVFELRDIWPASIVAVGAMRRGIVLALLERIELFLYRRAAAIVSVTNSFRDDLIRRGIDGGKIHVVINGVDRRHYTPRPRDAALAQRWGLDGKFVAGYLGTHGMAHALPKVLEAAELLRARTDIVLFFAGSGAERTHVEQIAAERHLENTRMIPRQPKSAMPALWSLCNVSLVPLRNAPLFTEVIPSKIFESMGMGVPIVMSLPEGEATRLIRETGCGVCVPPEDPEALADAIRALADDPGRVQALRSAALAAAPKFSRDVLAQSMLDVLVAVAARH